MMPKKANNNNNNNNNIIRIIKRNNSSSRRSSRISIHRRSMSSRNSLWFCFLICYGCHIFGLLCLAQFTNALPFEYDEFNYDLDTVQSQAKYDARLLSQQMVSDAELEQRTSAHTTSSHFDSTERDEDQQQDLEPHSRAASCFSNGRKYTHGQKVPRWDPCEVCLCMDGEIFCWWEKCDKANVNRAISDYSDPYRYETTTKKSTKLHKTGHKLGRRHKHHHKNQKNFNDYEVYPHSQHQEADYKSANKKQQKQKSANIDSTTTSASASASAYTSTSSGNYKAIKKHKHEQQHQKLNMMMMEQYKHGQDAAAPVVVNQAAKLKEMHHQQHRDDQQHEQQLERALAQQQHAQEREQHLHAQQSSPHSSSKILNFPENLPSLLYYDYKTEEHEHHQHQHHQQHLLHQKQRLLQQQQLQLKLKEQETQALQHQQQQQQQKQPQPSGSVGSGSMAAIELSTDMGIVDGSSSSFDEAETDSDILPEPPTKRPKTASTTKAAGGTLDTGKALMMTTTQPDGQTMTSAATMKATTTTITATTTTARETTTLELSAEGAMPNAVTVSAGAEAKEEGVAEAVAADKRNEMPQKVEQAASGVVALPSANQQQQQHDTEVEELDDAFHRWLTSTELNADKENTNIPDYDLAAAAVPATQQETSASSIIDDFNSKSRNSRNRNKPNNTDTANALQHADEGNRNTDIADNADAVFFRSSYNDYSSEFNGSVVNIDITLTAVDVHPPHGRLHSELPETMNSINGQAGQTDLIANDNKTAARGMGKGTGKGVALGTTISTAATSFPEAIATTTATTTITMDTVTPQAVSNNQHAVPPYTLTTIITTAPLAPERMCNVLGKLYKIGDILPQDTGNCLQCICTDAVTPDELPSVTCSPHNCPPLVLPDLFDATGY